jgi:hypothetical protein
MTTVAVGVHVHAELERFRATLAALADVGRGWRPQILLLPDGADPATCRVLATLDVPEGPLTPPYCSFVVQNTYSAVYGTLTVSPSAGVRFAGAWPP